MLRRLDGAARQLSPKLLAALKLCDGTQSLSAVCRATGAGGSDLLGLHDEGFLILWREAIPAQPPAVAASPRFIILSPHLDDAPLSLGGLMLAAQPGDTLVVDVFSRGAWWRFNHLADVEQIQQARNAEEDLMARLTRSALHRLELPEALLRGHTLGDVFQASPDPRDESACTAVRDALIELAARFPASGQHWPVWFLPLGVGNHLDHRIVRDAALEVLQQAQVPRARIHFYEEQPYAANLGDVRDFSTIIPHQTLKSVVAHLPGLHWKTELLRAYWSQFTWSDLNRLEAYTRRLAADQGQAERWWVFLS